MDEFGRVVVNNEVRPSPVAEDEEPFWEGWGDKARETANDLGLDFSSEKARVWILHRAISLSTAYNREVSLTMPWNQ